MIYFFFENSRTTFDDQMFLIVVPIPVFYAINYMQNTTLVDQGLLLNRAIFGWEGIRLNPSVVSWF
jgi:hypothetical protein